MLPASEERVKLAAGWLEIADGRIARLGEGAPPGAPDAGGEEQLLLPGFVDLHIHLPQFDSIGADGMTLLDWLELVIFPAEHRWAETGYAAAMTGRVIDQLLSRGTTAFAGYATVHHAGAVEALETAAARGVRAAIGQVLMDQSAPDFLCRPAAQLLSEAEALLGDGRWSPGARVEASLNPRFAISCSEALLRGCGELLARHPGRVVQTHLAETLPECEEVERLHGADRSYTEVYADAGLLDDRGLFAHGIYLDPGEMALLAEAGAAVAHCPTANRFLNSGTADRAALRAAGVPVALGSDVAGGPDRSLPRVARAMIDAAKVIGAVPPSPAEAWWQLTGGNASVIGWDDVGALEPGRAADLVLITPDVRWRDAVDPLGALLYGWSERWVDQVWLQGEQAL